MNILLRLFKLLWPFRWQILLATLLGCATIASNIGLLSMAAYLIAAAALGPLLVTLSIPMYIVRFAGVSRAGSRYAERLVSHDATFRLLTRLRIWVYSRLEPLAPGHLLTYRSGDILARLVSDVDELQNVYLRVFSPIIVAISMSAVTFFAFSLFDLRLAWVAVAFLGAAGLGVPLLVGLLARHLGRQQMEAQAELKTLLVESIQGMPDLLVYGQARARQHQISDLNQRLGDIQQRMASINGLQQALNDLCMNLAIVVILLLAIPLVSARAINGVYLGFLALLMLGSFEAVQPLAQAFQSLGHSLAAGKRLLNVIDAAPAVTERAEPLPVTTGTEHTLEYRQVRFAYASQQETILHDINLKLHPGRRVALVGASGSGKSTLARLALRFWDVDQGSILLDGQDIRQYALTDLRNLIAMVDQNTYLFNNTIRGNLRLARADASDSEIERAIERAQLSTFIEGLPDGLNTWIGEQGLRLSGGERQRLAIARALLKDAPILILDEATANLDPETEMALLDALEELMRERTTLVITHRLVAMERMDEILVLDAGRIRERGTHQELLQEGALYQQLFAMQGGILTMP
ncbi:MAG: thiol reductant ABC exporter subunit CydC [Ktedonobacteraceae bacterium]|nr:thiol reductant ABC exporter subunit CydC [Ktedonobacteraceae bacterium]MBO0790453.1 thiol reductant ABC exporter subunit CydC [Ktedonobacteraceae bacterium]